MFKISLNGKKIENVVSVTQYNSSTFRILYRDSAGKLDRIDVNIDKLSIDLNGEVKDYDKNKLDRLVLV